MKQTTKIRWQEAVLIEGIEQCLDAHDKYRQAREAFYKLAAEGEILTLDYQTDVLYAAQQARQQGQGTFSIEMAPGSGKSVVAARLAVESYDPQHLQAAERPRDPSTEKGPVLYICPNTTALGNLAQGIINLFHRVYWKTAGWIDSSNLLLGAVNDLSLASNVSFLTPRKMIQQHRDGRLLGFLARCPLVIVDESQHFPLDEKERLKIYGEVYRILTNDYVGKLKRNFVLTMTATHERMDGLRVMGKPKADFVFTVQQAVDALRCPEIYGIQVAVNITAKSASRVGEFYDIHLSKKEKARYYKEIARCMWLIYQRSPAPFAAFVRTQDDAHALAAEFNSLSGLGEKGARTLLGVTPNEERLVIAAGIRRGEIAGYVTCAVGEEALDIPSIEVIHLVRRCHSYPRNMQAIGRALRVMFGKKRALIVDYQMMIENVHARWLGTSLDDIAKLCHSELPDGKRLNGGPLVCQRSFPNALLVGLSLGEERALLLERRKHTKATDRYMQEYKALRRHELPKHVRHWRKFEGLLSTDNNLAEIPIARRHVAGEFGLEACFVPLQKIQDSAPFFLQATSGEKHTAILLSRFRDDPYTLNAIMLAAAVNDIEKLRQDNAEWNREAIEKVSHTLRRILEQAEIGWWDYRTRALPDHPSQRNVSVLVVKDEEAVFAGASFLWSHVAGRYGIVTRSNLPDAPEQQVDLAVVLDKVLLDVLQEEAEKGVPYELIREDPALLQILDAYTSPHEKKYNDKLATDLLDLAPDWFLERSREWSKKYPIRQRVDQHFAAELALLDAQQRRGRRRLHPQGSGPST